jgi:biotin transporter BioY
MPVYSEIEAPMWPIAAIALGALLSFFGGDPRFFGINIMLIATIPFFFIGLAVLHSISAAWPGRLFLLMGAYLFLILLVWPAAIIALLGLIEHWVRLRERMHARRSNKGNE